MTSCARCGPRQPVWPAVAALPLVLAAANVGELELELSRHAGGRPRLTHPRTDRATSRASAGPTVANTASAASRHCCSVTEASLANGRHRCGGRRQ